MFQQPEFVKVGIGITHGWLNNGDFILGKGHMVLKQIISPSESSVSLYTSPPIDVQLRPPPVPNSVPPEPTCQFSIVAIGLGSPMKTILLGLSCNRVPLSPFDFYFFTGQGMQRDSVNVTVIKIVALVIKFPVILWNDAPIPYVYLASKCRACIAQT